MPTYDNCYSLLEDVRRGLNEYSTALMQGTDTSGMYSNEYLVGKINKAIQAIHSYLFKRVPGAFRTSASVSVTSSVITLPWDFGIIEELRDADGSKVFPTSTRYLPANASGGSKRQYYRKGNTLVLAQSSVTDTYTIWYFTKPRRVEQGKASAGAALSLTLATTTPKIADYFNGMIIEDVTADWVDTIDDYTAARVCTLAAQTGKADDYYGIVSDIPDTFHGLIAPRALLNVRNEHPVFQDKKPTSEEKIEWVNELIAALSAFAGAQEDVPPEDIWCAFSGAGSGGGVNIPGHNNLVL